MDSGTHKSRSVPGELIGNSLLRNWARTVPAEFILLKGFIRLADGILITAATPVLTSKKQGPVEGILVVARLLDRGLITNWESTLGLRIEAAPEITALKAERTVEANPELGTPAYSVTDRPLNEDRIAAWIQMDDLAGVRSVAFRIDDDRIWYRQARSTLKLYGLSIGFVALVIGIGFLAILDRQVLSRLHRLALSVQEIAGSRDIHRRLPREKEDELGQLAAAGNGLLDALEQVTEDLVARERDLHTILENNPAAIVLVDTEKRTITWANGNAISLIGDETGRICGHLGHRYICAADVGECPVLDLKHERDSSERTLLRADGTLLPVYKRAAQVTYQGRAHLLEAFFDISHQKELEKELRRAQSMEMLGVLAGGVAHDLNNALMALVGYPDLMLLELDADHPFREPLETIRESARGAADLVEDLLTLARRKVALSERLCLNGMLADHLRSLQFKYLQDQHPAVAFRWKEPAQDLWISGSKVHLTKIFMNLLHNAAEAIEGQGRVEVVTRAVHLTLDRAGFEKIPAGHYAMLQVSDTGCGIQEDHLPHIFEPFFTRKSMQRSGTGLGMTVVWNCVKDMDGFIDVTSIVGRGTCFRIYIPQLEGDPAMAAAEVEPETRPGNGERVLMVEDMPEQRKVIEFMLQDLGYRVTTATDMEDALRKFEDLQPDVCIIDMIMSSGPDGLEIFKALRKLRPAQKAVIASGFAETDRVKEALRLGAAGYLKKPFSPQQLSTCLYNALRQDVCAPN